MDLGIAVLIILVLLFLSAFFSGSETALTAASKARQHAWEKSGNKRAGLVNKIRSKKDHMIGALLLGNNLVNILASAIATMVLTQRFDEAGVVYATLIMTLLVLIFAEVLPKTYALHYADRMSVAIAPIIQFVIIIFSPVALAVTALVRYVLKLLGADISKVSSGSHVEVLRGMIDLHEGEEEAESQRAMLRSILDLTKVSVEEIMVHRKNVEMIDGEGTTQNIIDAVLASPFTRLPVYKGKTDNIVGIIHTKSLMREVRKARGSEEGINIQDLVAEPWFVPDTTPLSSQLQAFRKRREHFATVVDEYGAFMGVVTLEDILEEIVGDIDDEHDVAVRGVQSMTNGSYIVNGSVTIRDLNREFEWNLPDEEYSTIAGLVIHEARCIPQQGQSFTFFGFQFDVIKRKRNQVILMRITPSLAEAA